MVEGVASLAVSVDELWVDKTREEEEVRVLEEGIVLGWLLKILRISTGKIVTLCSEMAGLVLVIAELSKTMMAEDHGVIEVREVHIRHNKVLMA
jgi:hypothetical protein